MRLTTPHLKDISFQVCRGNAAYGLLLANEYLAPNHPLRKALVGKAKFRLTSNTNLPEPLVAAIVGGAVAATLQDGWRTMIGPKVIRSDTKHLPVIFAPVKSFCGRIPNRRTAIRYRAQRKRSCISKPNGVPFEYRIA